ncbi:hypothetical protein K438DRAFT_1957468 [Mycena galopus ATCC 62051]|nr:hypothetical protein K438DRAFT_1957468 [Mycena galopus ATCC 62051]
MNIWMMYDLWDRPSPLHLPRNCTDCLVLAAGIVNDRWGIESELPAMLLNLSLRLDQPDITRWPNAVHVNSSFMYDPAVHATSPSTATAPSTSSSNGTSSSTAISPPISIAVPPTAGPLSTASKRPPSKRFREVPVFKGLHIPESTSNIWGKFS